MEDRNKEAVILFKEIFFLWEKTAGVIDFTKTGISIKEFEDKGSPALLDEKIEDPEFQKLRLEEKKKYMLTG